MDLSEFDIKSFNLSVFLQDVSDDPFFLILMIGLFCFIFMLVLLRILFVSMRKSDAKTFDQFQKIMDSDHL